MCRPSKLLACAAAALLAASPVARADEVAEFLDRFGLRELLAVHLEQRLERDRLAEDERDRLVVRLADLYASLLETVDMPERRAALEERSRRLLAAAPEASADQLRLALIGGSYRSAERTAENHRLRLATEVELATARDTLSDVIVSLQRFRQRLETRIESTQRRLSRAGGGLTILLVQEVTDLQELNARATFLAAWALYYQSYLHGRPDNARVAEDLFAELLELESAHDRTENVSVDRRGVEAYARSILGMALSKSLTSPAPTALAWLRLLEHESAFEPVRAQTPIWTIVILLEHDDFVTVRRQLDDLAAARPEVPMSWLRVIAAHALEAADRDRQAAELARIAVTRLAAQKELGQVLDLADRYGTEALGESGFALRYVSGILAYHEARDAHGDEQPTLKPDLVRRYEQASAEFNAALAEDDVGVYPSAAADARRLLAWCLYFRGEFLAARDAFLVAEAEASSEDAADLLWMAIVSLDRVVQAGESRALADQLAGLTERFLDQFPHSEHAPKLVLRQALAADTVTPGLVERLLAVPPGSDVADASRRQAASMLYQLFRAAPADERPGVANQYLDVAVPLFAQQSDLLAGSDVLERSRFVVRGRRILEVSLLDDVRRLVAAQNVLDAFQQAVDDGLLDLGNLADELMYRRLRRHLFLGDVGAADTLAEQLWAAPETSMWSRLAAQAMFRHGVEAWRGPDAREDDRRVGRDLVLRYGTRLVEDQGSDPDALRDATVLAVQATIAEAAFDAWEETRDAGRGGLALALYRQLLAVQPRNATFLRATALLSEQLGSAGFALECWRTLLAGASEYSDAWYEAKVHQVALLLEIDRDRARQVLQQHRLLNPAYGPEPWGERLRELETRLGGPPPEGESG